MRVKRLECARFNAHHQSSLRKKPFRNHIYLTHVLSNKTIQINKCITDAQIKWSIYINLKRPKVKNKISFNRSVRISHDTINHN
jgi:hypothetical protein